MKIAVFDFDGTIYKKDSLIEFCKYMYFKSPWRMVFLLLQLMALIAYKMKLLSTTKFKQVFLIYLTGINKEQLRLYVNDFWEKEKGNFNPEVLHFIEKIKEENIALVAATASPDFMFDDLSQRLGFYKWIATKTLYAGSKYSIEGVNCRGEEKLRRLDMEVDAPEIVYAFSDNADDDTLLKKAQKAYLITNNKIQEFK